MRCFNIFTVDKYNKLFWSRKSKFSKNSNIYFSPTVNYLLDCGKQRYNVGSVAIKTLGVLQKRKLGLFIFVIRAHHKSIISFLFLLLLQIISPVTCDKEKI